ncbi:MAG: glycosyltransferase family 1 protein [Pseudodesulfovibrio sp.]
MAVHTGIARYLKGIYANIRPDEAEVAYVLPGSVRARPPTGAARGSKLDALLSLHPRFVYLMRCLQWTAYECYLSRAARLRGVDVVHESFYTPVRLRGAARQVFTLHDLSLVKYPRTHSLDRRLFFDRYFHSRLAEADQIIVPSRFIAEELLDYAGLDESRVSVIHEGVGECFFQRSGEQVAGALARYGLPPRYMLFVGTLEPRKNLPVLLRAMARTRTDLPLVVVGWGGWGDPGFQEELQRLRLRDRVFLPGYLDDETLAALYSGATAFVYPSLYEGFGLPALEAMACGCPVLCSGVASLPEVAGGAALLAEPGDPEQWAHNMDAIAYNTELRGQLVRAGRERASCFSWRRAAEETLGLFHRVAAR